VPRFQLSEGLSSLTTGLRLSAMSMPLTLLDLTRSRTSSQSARLAHGCVGTTRVLNPCSRKLHQFALGDSGSKPPLYSVGAVTYPPSRGGSGGMRPFEGLYV
jgi:hypothetical protein